jgi:2-dehydro-3-deoxygluconokinase
MSALEFRPAQECRYDLVALGEVFGVGGARWFHTGGVFSALSPGTRELATQAMQAARRHGTVVSYDLNFRASLWSHADVPAADVNRRLVPHADVVIGNEEDYSAALGYVLEGVNSDLLDLDAATYAEMLGHVLADFPGGGDSFVSGLTYGLLAGFDVGTALASGIAHGALVMTTPGDTSMATLAEVRRLAAGRSARVIR